VIAFALSANQTAWWVTIAIGLVVALVVWALLELLRRAVNDVDRSVSDVWTMGKRVAQNTQTTHLLHTTKARGVELLGEIEEHRPPSSATGPAQPPPAQSQSPPEQPASPDRPPLAPDEPEQGRRFP
jgi:hypothetical protein